ncbi:cation channel sperm-associated protein 4-like [Colossoma macropomum]|uniref:cation channel sperm-associated protein 4-like n=1 Tax=Colossoma macropomum TaxID=42526 RepID=UPI001864606C|nr:cation channel sperm-associated protein 4-like [Colossoma macropomum]
MLLKLFTGFRIFWKNSWNLLDFAITVVLIAGPRTSSEFDNRVIIILQLIRSFRFFGYTTGGSVITHALADSIFELINVFLLLGGSMVLFGLIGVLLFRTSVPSAFADLPTALFTLFVSVTQDGWNEIQKKFEHGDPAIMYGAMVYFVVFICVGAFVFANFVIAVIITHLHIATEKYEGSSMTNTEDQATDGDITHVEEVVKNTKMTTHQRPRIGCRLDNLNVENFENLLLVGDAIHRNQREYLKLHLELEQILEEVSNLPINRKQEEEVMLQSQAAASVEENILSSKITSGRTGDVLSTLIALEKAHIIDSSADTPQIYAKGFVREGVRRMSMAAVESRRMSVV